MTAKDISETAEYIIHTHTSSEASKTTSARCTSYSSMTKLVITLTLLRIAKDIICFCDFFKLFFSLCISRIFIWVILNCEFAICFLQSIFIGTLINAKNFVIISFSHNLFLSYDYTCMTDYLITKLITLLHTINNTTFQFFTRSRKSCYSFVQLFIEHSLSSFNSFNSLFL